MCAHTHYECEYIIVLYVFKIINMKKKVNLGVTLLANLTHVGRWNCSHQTVGLTVSVGTFS